MIRFLCLLPTTVVSVALLTACGGQSVSGSTPTVTVLQASGQIESNTLRRANTEGTKKATLYVGNQPFSGDASISIYSNGGAKLLRSIPLAGRAEYGFIASQQGFLFTWMPEGSNGKYPLDIYKERGAKLVQTLTFKQPLGLAIDESGNLFVQCALARVCEYPADAKIGVQNTVSRTIQLKNSFSIQAIATDPRSGNVALLVPPHLYVYPPGAIKPSWTISNLNLAYFREMAFDYEGNLYVGSTYPSSPEVEVFSPGATSPTRTIVDSNGLYLDAIALDQGGNLYMLTGECLRSCSTQPPPAVTVYAPGGSVPSRTVTDGIETGVSLAMAVSGSGQLFVGNGGLPGNIVVYPSGANKPNRTISQGVDQPTYLRVSQ